MTQFEHGILCKKIGNKFQVPQNNINVFVKVQDELSCCDRNSWKTNIKDALFEGILTDNW